MSVFHPQLGGGPNVGKEACSLTPPIELVEYMQLGKH